MKVVIKTIVLFSLLNQAINIIAANLIARKSKVKLIKKMKRRLMNFAILKIVVNRNEYIAILNSERTHFDIINILIIIINILIPIPMYYNSYDLVLAKDN